MVWLGAAKRKIVISSQNLLIKGVPSPSPKMPLRRVACAKITGLTNTAKHHTGFDHELHSSNVSKFLAPLNEWNSTAVAISLPLNGHQLTYGLDSIDKPAQRLDAVHKREDKTLGAMIKDDRLPHSPDFKENPSIMAIPLAAPPQPKLEWDWDIEHEDRRKEAKADAAMHGAAPFLVDRRVLKDVVTEKVGVDVGRISFLSSGTFHKAYLITLADRSELVARVARRFMPRLKTESEVATMSYLRENTNIPVPTVYHYDSNPYNRLGGEYILMPKASGIPLSRVYHSMPYNELVKLLDNLAALIIPLFAHRFPQLGSLYFDSSANRTVVQPSSAATPRASEHPYTSFPFLPVNNAANLSLAVARKLQKPTPKPASQEITVGPIISWPFFGSGRGDLSTRELDRGPWASASAYFEACAKREISGVIRENEGKSAPHRLHLDPDEIHSSRHHHLSAVPDDQSDDSDEYDLEESEEEWEGPGDAMYRDYRRMQRSTFLVAHLSEREERVRTEMQRFMQLMTRLTAALERRGDTEEFGLDCHDLSLENVFVDAVDNTKITCIIDWESTTTRPLWACAHLPAFLQSSPFVANLFRESVARLGATKSTVTVPKSGKTFDYTTLARDWLYYEHAGTRLRMAHRYIEWDGWEEGLADSILGSEDMEDEWFKEPEDPVPDSAALAPESRESESSLGELQAMLASTQAARRKTTSKLPFPKEKDKEQMLDTSGDICGGRGGELGRRLEAWLTVSEQRGSSKRSVAEGHDEDYEAEAE
ncbi:Altered inheritance of mitochondria protein 9, mitochondrial [Pleurotus pulmonarius]